MAENLNVLVTKFRGALSQLPYLPQALSLVWAASRSWTLAWGLLLAGQGFLPAVTVYLTRWLVDSLVAALGAGGDWSSIRPVVVLVSLMAGAMLLLEFLRSLTGWIRTTQAELVQDHINTLIHEKSTTVDLAFYESPEYYDHLHRARSDASHRPVALLENIGNLLQNGITLIAMAAVLLPYGLWLPVALLVSTLPAFYVVLHYNLRQHQWRLHTTADERRTWYYDQVLTTEETAAELRLFELGEYFRSAYQTLRRRLRHERLRLARGQSLAELGAGSAALLVTGAALGWMAWRAVQGFATLGELALFYQAFNQGQRLMRSLLENVGQIYSNSLFLGHLFEFLALEPEVMDPPRPVHLSLKRSGVSIRFHQVSFCYPGSGHEALQGLDLTIPAGQVTAIVGANGAGKSTLIKLLCRLYDPQAGQIELNGIDLRDLSLQELRRLITVLFQEPVHYSASAAENIALGNLLHTPGMAEIRTAALAAGADEPITRLPQGYHTPLGKWFAGGAELSVGEWQRVALARAFLRQAPLIILDEPTSAMDSWAEADWLERLTVLAAGRTTMIITHRFTTAMRADVIHVMEGGQIVESGSHADLLAWSGRYAQSWRAQMQARRGPANGVSQKAFQSEVGSNSHG